MIVLIAAGKLGGNYLITASHHRVTRTGYTVDKEVCRISASSINLTQASTKPDLALSTYGITHEVVV